MPIEDLVDINAKIMCKHYYFTYYKSYRPIGHRNFEKKYLKYFIKAAEMFCVRQGFKPEGFVDSVLAEGFVFPMQFPYERNWEVFQRNKVEFAQEKVVEKPSVVLARRVAGIFSYLNNRTIEQITSSPFTSQDLITDYADDNLDLCVYCFSKSFIDFAKKENIIIDFAEEQNKIKKYKKIFEKIKEKLGNDFIEI